MATGVHAPVLTVADIRREELEQVFAPQGLTLVDVPPGAPIPGSYWGDSEAGLVDDDLFVRADTADGLGWPDAIWGGSTDPTSDIRRRI